MSCPYFNRRVTSLRRQKYAKMVPRYYCKSTAVQAMLTTLMQESVVSPTRNQIATQQVQPFGKKRQEHIYRGLAGLWF